MKRLIIEEYKKLFKKKSVLVLTILTIICTLGICYKQYFQYDVSKYVGEFYTQDGNRISCFEALKARDEIWHRYAGEWSEEKENKINQDLDNELKKYPRDQLDEKAMAKNYGKDWKNYLEKENQGLLTEEDINQLIDKLGYWVSVETFEDGTAKLHKIYTNDPQREYLSYLYTGNSMYHQDQTKYEFSEWNAYLNNPTFDKIKQVNYLLPQNLTENQNKAFTDKFMKEVESLPRNFDSILPNERMMCTFRIVNILPIFVIMIVLANIFTIESECKTDQIIYPTKLNKYRITLSKLFVGYSYSIGLVWLQLLIVYVFGMIVFPVHQWNILIVNGATTLTNMVPSIPVTYAVLLMYAILIPTFAAIAIATITMFLSYVLKRKFGVIIILFVYMIIGLILSQMEIGNLSEGTHVSYWIYYFIQQLHPLSMSMYNLYFANGNFWYHIGSPFIVTNGMVIEMKNVVMIVWGAISVLVSFVIARLSKKQYIWK